MPREWDDSFIINLYKGKGEALDTDVIIWDIWNIDDMQFDFMLGRDTTDAYSFWDEFTKIISAKNYNLYFAFVDLEKAFDRVSRVSPNYLL